MSPDHEGSMDFREDLFNKEAFHQDILRFADIDLGTERTLHSGRTSSLYIDCRPFNTSYTRLHRFAEHIASYLADYCDWTMVNFDITHFVAVPDSTTYLAALLNVHMAEVLREMGILSITDVPFTLVRKSVKAHGTTSSASLIGATHGTPLLLEDVVSTGDSVLETLSTLEHEGLRPCAVLCLIDRLHKVDEGTAKDRIESKGYPFIPMTTLKDLLPSALTSKKPSHDTLKKVREELLTYHYGFEDFDFDSYLEAS